mmetsp:Transcript_6614/g.7455  ORF Transcript_6614/g.7455 Transcript_6614/m.7455 type:complete len:220 (+) Transcript_6614:197-856(+)
MLLFMNNILEFSFFSDRLFLRLSFVSNRLLFMSRIHLVELLLHDLLMLDFVMNRHSRSLCHWFTSTDASSGNAASSNTFADVRSLLASQELSDFGVKGQIDGVILADIVVLTWRDIARFIQSERVISLFDISFEEIASRNQLELDASFKFNQSGFADKVEASLFVESCEFSSRLRHEFNELMEAVFVADRFEFHISSHDIFDSGGWDELSLHFTSSNTV